MGLCGCLPVKQIAVDTQHKIMAGSKLKKVCSAYSSMRHCWTCLARTIALATKMITVRKC